MSAPTHVRLVAVHCRETAGFTLVEVLVALVIVAVGMAAVMGALTSSANNVSYMRDKTFAEWVALNQIATLRLKLQAGQLPTIGNSNGDLDYAGRSWHWRQEVVQTQVKGIVRIDLSVRPAEVKASEDAGWFTTVSGLVGDAVAAPGVNSPSWDIAIGGQPQANPTQSPTGTNPTGTNPTGTNPTGTGSTPPPVTTPPRRGSL